MIYTESYKESPTVFILRESQGSSIIVIIRDDSDNREYEILPTKNVE